MLGSGRSIGLFEGFCRGRLVAVSIVLMWSGGGTCGTCCCDELVVVAHERLRVCMVSYKVVEL